MLEPKRTPEQVELIEGVTSSLLSSKHKRIPLKMAEQYIIPYYIQKVDVKDDEVNSNYINNMLEITGSYHVGLEVTENGVDEPVLYILPPLLGSLKDNLNISRYLERYRALRSSNPTKANKMLQGKVHEASDLIEVDDREVYLMHIRRLRNDYGAGPTSKEDAVKKADEEDIYDW